MQKNYNLICFFILFLSVTIPFQSYSQLQFNNHPIPPGFPTTASQKKINGLKIDASNNKWISFASFGLGVYNNNNWTIYNTANSGLPSDSVICVEIDNLGNAWIGTKEGAVYKSGGNYTVYNTSNSGLPSNTITSIFSDGATTWFGTKNGLASFDGNNWLIYNTGNSGLENDSITCITKSQAGDLWIGTRTGLTKYVNGNWSTLNTSNSPLNSYIIDIKCDNYDRTWISSGQLAGGISTNLTSIRLHFHQSGIVKTFQNDIFQFDLEIYHNVSLTIAKDAAGLISFPCSFGGTQNVGFFVVDGNDYTFYEYPYSLYTNLKFDSNGNLWGLTKYWDKFHSYDFNDYQYPWGTLNYRNHRSLDVNDVKAGINADGFMHFDYANPKYMVPKTSGKHSVFASSMWIGGLDASGDLHLAAETYRQTGKDYWPGPIDGISIPFDSSSCIQFDRVWKMDKWKIEEFKNQFLAGNVTNGSYAVPEEIASWPAQGNGLITGDMAPFVDYNSNGIYDFMNGDYPEIKGDQMLFYIFNDSLADHTETSGKKLGVEVHASAYSYYCPNIADSNQVLNWTTLYHYKIINKSPKDYNNVYIGLWCDTDLGKADDDYVGCDTVRSAGFVYNGDNHDETASGYGFNPPMQNIKILRGVIADASDGIDNDLDGIVDEVGERTNMNHFQYYDNVNNSPIGNPGGGLTSTPAVAANCYSYLKSEWLDGQPVTYGNDGRDTTSSPTNFMFSGVPFDNSGWTEFSSNNTPGDRRFVMSSGPFSLAAGQSVTIDYAYIFTWDSLSPNGLTTSVARNQADLDRVQYWFDTNSFPSCVNYSVGASELEIPSAQITVYPNPASTKLFIKSENENLFGTEYSVFNLLGEEVLNGRILSNNISIEKLPTQNYILQLKMKEQNHYIRFVKN